uniref:Uncharacterized protein n=1 Tax=Sphaerodactylus townsendi TaxID=933632 RepID=A0ACB8EET4_9SAUR
MADVITKAAIRHRERFQHMQQHFVQAIGNSRPSNAIHVATKTSSIGRSSTGSWPDAFLRATGRDNASSLQGIQRGSTIPKVLQYYKRLH